MQLSHGHHLAYCTNIHRGETWAETRAALEEHTLAVRRLVSPDKPYAIGLRLSFQAARELRDPVKLKEFKRWLDREHCYVFTINGFPYGRFHGDGVKEQVYQPDWTSEARVIYTNLLFDLLEWLLPNGVAGSVSTVPCGCKGVVQTPEQMKIVRHNLWRCVEHIARLSQQTGRPMHLGLEPEPLCVLETTGEVVSLFDRLRIEHHNDPRLAEFLGVNYDTCHLAIEFEEPQTALEILKQHGIRLSKLHLSSALKVRPTAEAREALRAFCDDVYLHQVVVRHSDGHREIYRDLGLALDREAGAAGEEEMAAEEWRIHFHVPLHAPALEPFETTSDHLVGALDWLQCNPTACHHLEIETYTWEVLPAEFRARSVVDQLVAEYEWVLARLGERGLA